MPSMEPRLFSRGNPRALPPRGARAAAFNGAAALQPRKRVAPREEDVRLGPSMEPRLFSRGNRAGPPHLPRAHAPSMEPRLFSRGNRAGPPHLPRAHAPSMEPRLFSRGNRPKPGAVPRPRGRLQWSRGSSAAET